MPSQGQLGTCPACFLLGLQREMMRFASRLLWGCKGQSCGQIILGWTCKAFWSSLLDPFGRLLSLCCSSGYLIPIALAQLGMLGLGNPPLYVCWQILDEGCRTNLARATNVCPAPALPTIFEHICFTLM